MWKWSRKTPFVQSQNWNNHAKKLIKEKSKAISLDLEDSSVLKPKNMANAYDNNQNNNNNNEANTGGMTCHNSSWHLEHIERPQRNAH